MDVGQLIIALIFGLPYGYFLFLFTGYHVLDNLNRMFYASSPQMFSSFYDANQNGYKSYSYFHKTSMPPLTYLRAFERYDEETAFKEYKQLIRSGIEVFSRKLLLHMFIIFILGIILFAEPPYFYLTILGYYLVQLAYIFARQCWYKSRLIAMCGDFVPLAFQYAYGDTESEALLKSDPTKQDFSVISPIDQEYPTD